MINYKRRIMSGALVLLLLLAGLYPPALFPGAQARASAASIPAPDLVIESLTFLPEAPSIGDTLAFTVRVKNRGDSQAGASRVAFFLDGNALAVSQIDLIDPGAVEVPALTWKAQAGPHIFRASADLDDSVAESSEDNNDKTCAFTVLAPDLAIDAISWTPSNPAAGEKVTFTVKIINQSDKRAGVSHVDFSIDGNSRGYHSILGMEAGARANETYTWIATPGVHTVRAAADILQQVTESDEANNASEATCATKEPDLIISSISMLPVNISENTTVDFTINIKNQGGSRAGPSSVTYYIDGSQQYSDPLEGLEPDAATTANFTWVAGIRPTTFKATVDAYNLVKESDEANNSKEVIFPLVFPDFIIQDITWSPSSPLLHDFVTVTVTVKNQGNRTAGAVKLSFNIDNGLFYDAMIPELPAGDSTPAAFTFMTQLFSHTVKASIDAANLIKESNESNNTLTKTVTSTKLMPSADLIPEKITFSPGRPVRGEPVTVILNVKNAGSGKASPSYAAIYIDNKMMDEIYVDELGGGTMVSKEITLALQGLPFKDTHTFKAVLDAHNTVFETNESNNELQASFSTFAPDLLVQAIRWSPEAPTAGDRITFDVTVKNRGDLKVGTTYISYYADKTFMGTHRIDNIEPGTTVTRSFTWASLKGSFAFTSIVDEANEINESDEANNARTAFLPAPDLLIDPLTWSPEIPTGNTTVTFTATIRNRGFGKSPGTLLSCDINGAAQAPLDVGEISPGETAAAVFTHAFPPGEHTIRLVADGNDAVTESNEGNNENTLRFSIQPLPPPPSPVSANKTASNQPAPASTVTIATSVNLTAPNNTPATTPAKDVAANITAPPPKWQSIIQSKLFIFGFGAGGIGAIGVLLLLRKRTKKA